LIVLALACSAAPAEAQIQRRPLCTCKMYARNEGAGDVYAQSAYANSDRNSAAPGFFFKSPLSGCLRLRPGVVVAVHGIESGLEQPEVRCTFEHRTPASLFSGLSSHCDRGPPAFPIQKPARGRTSLFTGNPGLI